MVDTGGAWTIFHHDLARSLGLMEFEGLTGTVIKTWMGDQHGKLVKCPLTLCADRGHELTVDATVFVSETWAGHNILGYNGLLMHLRTAFDPQQAECRWFFGDLG